MKMNGLGGGVSTSFEILSLLFSEWVNACLGRPRGTSSLVLLNASYHKKHEYVWFRGGDLNCFRDIKPFMK